MEHHSLSQTLAPIAISVALAVSVGSEARSTERPQVVASYSVLCDLVEQIAEDTLDLTCLIEGGVDPHLYAPTPGDRRAIEDANLIFYGGYNFEPDIIELVEATNNSAPKIAVHEEAVSNPLMGEGHHHHHDEEHDDSHHHHHDGSPDPHIWHNAEHGIEMVKLMAEELGETFPENADLYDSNAEILIAELEDLDEWIETQVETIPRDRRTVISTHEALGYYGDAYGLTIEGALNSLSTEARPSASRIREVVEIVRETGVPTIFAELTANPRLMETVAREADVTVASDRLFVDGLAEVGSPAATYQGMLEANTCAIVNGLGGTCTPFSSP